MKQTTPLGLLLALLLIGTGCPSGSWTFFGLDDDDDSAQDDDDDSADDDDDDATPPDDDDVTPSDDDDSTPPDDDDDLTPPDDDDSVPGDCVPAEVISCGQVVAGNNGGPGSTQSVEQYGCQTDFGFSGPEFVYEFIAEATGEHSVSLGQLQEDLDLLVLDGSNGCDPDSCLGGSFAGGSESELVVFQAEAGQTIHVVVEGFDGSVSDFRLELGCPDTGDDDDATPSDDDDATPTDDDDATPTDDDDATEPVCGQFFVKGVSAGDMERFDWNGTGFDAAANHNPPGNGQVWSAVAGDFDGDTDLDFITARGGNGYAAHLYENNCDGTFTSDGITNNGFEFPDNIEDMWGVADLDGDGDLDVLGWEYWSGDGVVWLNDGDGTSWETEDEFGPNDNRPFELAYWDPQDDNTHEVVAMPPVDLTQDGVPDFVECANSAVPPTVCTAWIGNGDGSFTSAPGASLDRVVNGLAVADFNGDGWADIVGGLDDDGDAGQVWFWETNPLAPAPASGPGVEAFDLYPAIESGNDNPGYGWMYPYDWDSDGDIDIIANVMDPAFGNAQTVFLALNNGSAVFTVTEVGSTVSSTGGEPIVQTQIGVPAFN